MMNEQLQGELLSVHENSQIYPGAPTDISPHGAVDYLGYWTPGESMHEQINFDLLGQRCLVFGDVAVTHFTDEIYFVLPIPLPFANVPGLNGPMTFSIQSERPMENPDDPTQ